MNYGLDYTGCSIAGYLLLGGLYIWEIAEGEYPKLKRKLMAGLLPLVALASCYLDNLTPERHQILVIVNTVLIASGPIFLGEYLWVKHARNGSVFKTEADLIKILDSVTPECKPDNFGQETKIDLIRYSDSFEKRDLEWLKETVTSPGKVYAKLSKRRLELAHQKKKMPSYLFLSSKMFPEIIVGWIDPRTTGINSYIAWLSKAVAEIESGITTADVERTLREDRILLRGEFKVKATCLALGVTGVLLGVLYAISGF